LGGVRTVKVDIRLIAATNLELEKDIAAGRFREDLYYRLNVVPIILPPLRERKEDIPPLADHFLAIYREKNRKSVKGISGKAQDLLVRYDWPGNIRELENCIERAVIMAREEAIVPADFPPQIRMLSQDQEKDDFMIPSGISLDEMERALIVQTLAETGGNRTKTSEILGINRRTLQNKLRQYGLNNPPPSGPF
jgi:two-component system response regulator HydG